MENSLDWESLGHYGQLVNLPSNSVLFRQGDFGNGFYYLREGEVKISIISYHGNERFIDLVFPGQLIGEHGIHNSPYITTAETIKDSSFYFFSKKNFLDLCEDVPDAAEELSLSLATKIRMMVKVKSILNAPLEIQLAYLFDRFYEKTKNNKISLSQKTISNFVGTSRVTIWKILKEWKEKQIISIEDRVIYLDDIPKIKQMVDSILN